MSHAQYISLGCAVLFAAVAVTSAAHAQAPKPPAVAILALDLAENLPADVVKSCASQVGPAVQGDERKFRYIDAATARTGLMNKSPALAGCFELDCIKRAGTILEANIGVRASVTGEAQIYDIKVGFYDLTTGKKIQEEAQSCEICTANEVGNTFAKTLQLGLRKVEVTTAAKVEEEPKVKVPPTKDPVAKIPVKVRVLPAEAMIELGDLPLGSGTAATELEPGQYTLRGTLDGYQTQEVPVSIEPKGNPFEIYVQLAPEPEVREVSTGGGMQKSTARVVTGWILAVVGAGGAGAGGYLLWLDGQVTCSTGSFSECPNVFETTTPGILAFGAGVAALTTGVFLIALDATAQEAPAPTASGFDLGLDPTSGAGVVQFRTNF